MPRPSPTRRPRPPHACRSARRVGSSKHTTTLHQICWQYHPSCRAAGFTARRPLAAGWREAVYTDGSCVDFPEHAIGSEV